MKYRLESAHAQQMLSVIGLVRDLHSSDQGAFATLTAEEYQLYIMVGTPEPAMSEPDDSASVATPNPTATTAPVISSKHVVDPSEAWDKGIKRNASVYPNLTKDEALPAWIRDSKAQAMTRGCEDVFDSTYTPKTTAESELFDRHQKFIYGMLARNLKTIKGKNLVRKYAATFDAQSIIAALQDDLSSGVHQRNYANSLLVKLQGCTMDTLSIPGVQFLETWQSFLLDYNDACVTQPTHEDLRLILDAAIAPHKPFQAAMLQANNTEHILKAKWKTSTSVNFDSYFEMLLVNAKTLDHSDPVKSTKSQRANQSDRSGDRPSSNKGSMMWPKFVEKWTVPLEKW